MGIGEGLSRGIGWSDGGSHAGGETAKAILDDFGLPATERDEERRGSDAASSAAGRQPGVNGTVIYLDPRTFTRDCVGRWLQSYLSGFTVCALPDPEQIIAAPAVIDRTRAVIINTGPDRMSSAGVATLIARVAELVPHGPGGGAVRL